MDIYIYLDLRNHEGESSSSNNSYRSCSRGQLKGMDNKIIVEYSIIKKRKNK